MKDACNSAKLKTLVEQAGGTTNVAYEADVGSSTLTKLMTGAYPALPRRRLREKLCAYFKVQERDLFPFVGAKASGTRSEAKKAV